MYAIHINIFQLLVFIVILPKNMHHSIANTSQNSTTEIKLDYMQHQKNWTICIPQTKHKHTHTPISLAYKKCRNNETKYQYKKLLVKKKNQTYYWWRQTFNSLASSRHAQTTDNVLPNAHWAYLEAYWSHSLSAFCFILLLKATFV